MNKINLPYKDVSCYLKGKNIIIQSKKPFKVLSSAVSNGGLCFAKTILNHQVSKDFNNPDPETYLHSVIEKLGLSQPVVGLMTAANVSNVSVKTDTYKNGKFVSVLATAGLSNSATAGDKTDSVRSNTGTINIIVLVDGNLTDGCLVEAVKTVTEAKTVALRELDIRSSFSRRVATGTTTDSVVIACTGKGEKTSYIGAATKLGKTLSLNVIEAVKTVINKEENSVSERPLIKRLEERGITAKAVINAIMELLVHHPSMGTREKAIDVLKEEFNKAVNDVNVASLVLACMRLEEDGKIGLIPDMPVKTFNSDPVFLLADEILGLNIAEYIAGSKGIFEFVRFDKAKPGIIKKLGPFLDDAIGGLAAGISSNMYTRLLSKLNENESSIKW